MLRRRGLMGIAVMVILAAGLVGCAPFSEPPLPTTEPTTLDCRTPEPLPQHRWGDCDRAAVGSIGWGEDPKVLDGSYNVDDHTMVIHVLASVSKRERHDYQDRVQRATGLRTVVLVETDRDGWRCNEPFTEGLNRRLNRVMCQ